MRGITIQSPVGSSPRCMQPPALPWQASPRPSALRLESCRRPGPVHGSSRARCPVGLGSTRAAARRQGAPLRQVTRCSALISDPLAALGTDFLLFLGATVLVVPVFKSAKQSPVLGYLFAGLVMGQLGLFRNYDEIEKLSELGVLFLLFEMGLELSIDKLKALAKFAFGLGTLQMLTCIGVFTAVALPVGNGLMTKFLEVVLHASPALSEIRTVDEAIVIAAALSLSSSAFVLQLLKERGELDTKFGQATLGILLFQDIATVPFLVLLPLIEAPNDAGVFADGADKMSLLRELAPTLALTLGGLALVMIGGRTFLRRVFELVAEARSSETFVALCLLSVAGASLLTQRLGFSDTLGAFVAGVLLSETNFKTQVEADIQPFRGILLGLFFVTTGASLDVALLIKEWPIVITLLVGLLALKTTVIAALGPSFGLTKAESIRTGFVLSQGGEFAFVLLALANQLSVLPEELNRLLIIVVVLSMAVTPVLTEAGKIVADILTDNDGQALGAAAEEYCMEEPVLICGFNDVGQTVANMLLSPALGKPVPYVAFDLTVGRVQAAQEEGFNVLYGDGSRAKVLQTAGVSRPRAIVVAFTARQRAITAVETLRETYEYVPIYARALDMQHAVELQRAGATTVVTAETEAGLLLGSQVTEVLGMPRRAREPLVRAMREGIFDKAIDMAIDMDRAEMAVGGGGGGPSKATSIFRFDHSRVNYSADTEIASDSSASDILGALLSKVGGSGSSLDGEDDGRLALLSATGSSRSGSSLDEEGAAAREEGESTRPDGTIDCPVAWDAMSVDETVQTPP